MVQTHGNRADKHICMIMHHRFVMTDAGGGRTQPTTGDLQDDGTYWSGWSLSEAMKLLNDGAKWQQLTWAVSSEGKDAN